MAKKSANNHQALKIVIWIVAVYHIILGLLGIFAKDYAVSLAKAFFNFNLTFNDQMYWVINPFSAYVLIFGVFMAVAATDPSKYKNIIYAGIGLFAIRIIQRVLFYFTAPETLISSVDPIRNIIMILVVAIIGIAMFFLVKKVE